MRIGKGLPNIDSSTSQLNCALDLICQGNMFNLMQQDNEIWEILERTQSNDVETLRIKDQITLLCTAVTRARGRLSSNTAVLVSQKVGPIQS